MARFRKKLTKGARGWPRFYVTCCICKIRFYVLINRNRQPVIGGKGCYTRHFANNHISKWPSMFSWLCSDSCVVLYQVRLNGPF